MAELLGRTKSERRASLDAPAGSRNGHGKPRRLALMNSTISVRRPRVRDMVERFASRLLPLFERQTQEVPALLESQTPECARHGAEEAPGGAEGRAVTDRERRVRARRHGTPGHLRPHVSPIPQSRGAASSAIRSGSWRTTPFLCTTVYDSVIYHDGVRTVIPTRKLRAARR